MSVKYRELSFRTEEEREKAVRYIMENAEASLPGTRVVRIERTTFRVGIHKLKEQFFLVYKPRRGEILLPRIWLVTIPGFKLCDIPVGREMGACNRRVTSVAVDDHELIYVCDYHGSGFRVFKELFEKQLRKVPPSLCFRFCPQSKRDGHKIVEGRERTIYECRAFMPYVDEKEELKRRRSYRGMYILCVEDWWWGRYLRRHKFE